MLSALLNASKNYDNMMRLLLLLYCAIVSHSAFSEEPKPTPVTSLVSVDPVVTSSPLTVLLGLLFVLIVIFALAWLAKQYNNSGLIGNRTMKVVASMPLGTRERAVLIEVGDKQILVGVSPSSVNALHVFDEKIIDDDSLPNHPFAKKLNQFLQPKNKNEQQESDS
jgi:flagellar protein FliO/FliZ